MLKYLLLAVFLTSASHSKALIISGNYKAFDGVQSYNYAINYGIIDYEYIKSSKYFYEAVEANYSYNKWLGYARLAEHSKSANKTEHTVSIGYQFIDACNVSVGHREDIAGSSLLIRPSCNYKLENLGIKAAYIYTVNANIYTLKVKYEVTDTIFIKYKLLKFDADNVMHSYTANVVSFGVNFKMKCAGEHEAVNALINAVDKELQAFKQQRLKAYPKEYYSKPANRQRRNIYNNQYQQMLKLKQLKITL